MKNNEPLDFDLSDFDYFMAAIGVAAYYDLTAKELLPIAIEAETGEEFDAGVEAICNLKELSKTITKEDT